MWGASLLLFSTWLWETVLLSLVSWWAQQSWWSSSVSWLEQLSKEQLLPLLWVEQLLMLLLLELQLLMAQLLPVVLLFHSFQLQRFQPESIALLMANTLCFLGNQRE